MVQNSPIKACVKLKVVALLAKQPRICAVSFCSSQLQLWLHHHSCDGVSVQVCYDVAVQVCYRDLIAAACCDAAASHLLRTLATWTWCYPVSATPCFSWILHWLSEAAAKMCARDLLL